jgi:hypothetical protein
MLESWRSAASSMKGGNVKRLERRIYSSIWCLVCVEALEARSVCWCDRRDGMLIGSQVSPGKMIGRKGVRITGKRRHRSKQSGAIHQPRTGMKGSHRYSASRRKQREAGSSAPGEGCNVCMSDRDTNGRRRTGSGRQPRACSDRTGQKEES